MGRQHWCRLAAALAFAALASVTHAETSPLTDGQAKKLFSTYNCNACHAVDETRLGPAFRSVALRYRGASPDTAQWLATKIIAGGAGSWGVVPMVGNPAVSADEALAISRWILGLAPPVPRRGAPPTRARERSPERGGSFTRPGDGRAARDSLR